MKRESKLLSRFHGQTDRMKIEELKLINFRNYTRETIFPHEGINLFFGPNGSGKTNLLEAIHYCALGKSHRVSNDQNVVRNGENLASCSMSVRSRMVRRDITVHLAPNETVKKEIEIDHKKIRRFSELMGCLQCVIFSPEDLGLIREGPSLRRRYMDMMISQLNRGYFIALQQYRLGMEQRNALLKTCRINPGTSRFTLEDFERAMAVQAAVIVTERRMMGEKLSRLAMETYKSISGQEKEEFSLIYHSSLRDEEKIEEALMRHLRENREEDIRLGITSVGPHRDDLILTLNKKNMKMYASQGQIRTAALSLKLSQMKALKMISGEDPVLLLDDVMSELDRNRRSRLLKEIGSYQTFITCTDETDLEDSRAHRSYRVSAENGKGTVTETSSGISGEKPTLCEPDFS